ncbi:MAG: type I phosphomannose isomerase catalytic subunit [Polyangiales bacterium]
MSHPAPALLAPDNFTPATRTPWGGTRIARAYKNGVGVATGARIGESWEVSVEPDFPARLASGQLLGDYIANDPAHVLGGERHPGATGTALLVKLLDADEPLSVQIHPSDAYPRLSPGESGKPESWYVVERAPGAGFYLGFRRGTREDDVRAALAEGASLEPLLRFVPVEPGDFFVIDAGTPHAIGAGVTLIEPQHVAPGARGVTYRYWDWNRRYDAEGRADPHGKPRALHVDHALAVTEWERVQADGFIESIRVRAGSPALEGPAVATPLAGDGGLANAFLRVTRLAGTGSARLPAAERLHGITVVDGTVRLGELQVTRGRSAVVPACCAGMTVELARAHALVCAIA